ncbi:hypothetical protein MITS9509_03424 [Synechococcus sp. MIT S9509]|uniref:hypothetical protein n=1 Tax=unclassified Synechococcus TaxID=2626047 RepID=UPI0007BB7099|nr:MULTISPECIES: hypothetical protein [unclassified Synechococcus]KZR86068.1 hypothetical protein MITS9504_01474 [Synechococcus sp. MIT S9504]KZR87135.1 hypothetical protein MITS9509_03424 [Synechococcus sp. MIT S9509]
MVRFQFFSAVSASLLSALLVSVFSSPVLEAAPRNVFPGRRIGGGTRGECAARPVVHLVPASNVFSPGARKLIAVLEGPSANPQPLDVTLQSASADGIADPGAGPLMQKQIPAAVNRLVLLSIPAAPVPMLWESSYRCGTDGGADEFGFITSSAPPARSLLLPDGSPEAQNQRVEMELASLKAACGTSMPLAHLKTVFQFDDEVINDSWPEQVTVQCF